MLICWSYLRPANLQPITQVQTCSKQPRKQPRVDGSRTHDHANGHVPALGAKVVRRTECVVGSIPCRSLSTKTTPRTRADLPVPGTAVSHGQAIVKLAELPSGEGKQGRQKQTPRRHPTPVPLRDNTGKTARETTPRVPLHGDCATSVFQHVAPYYTAMTTPAQMTSKEVVSSPRSRKLVTRRLGTPTLLLKQTEC